jgi:hypothetical protein
MKRKQVRVSTSFNLAEVQALMKCARIPAMGASIEGGEQAQLKLLGKLARLQRRLAHKHADAGGAPIKEVPWTIDKPGSNPGGVMK